MQANFSSSRILLPVKRWFIFLSLFVALILNFLPTSAWHWMPDWVAMTLIFWSIRESRHIGMRSAFLLGLIMDVANASLLGQHALAYVAASYLASSLSRRILWFPLWQQALHALPLLLIVQVVQIVVRILPETGVELPGISYFLGPFLGMIVWPLLTFILLLPQYQPVEQDDNRPI